MSPYVQAPVLVGVDGSRGSLRALRVAAAEAVLRELPLRLVHVANADTRGGRTIVAEAYVYALRRHPGLAIDPQVVRGQPGPVLVDESARAALTVLGRRGHSAAAGPLAGSVSVHVACHGQGPVLIARGDRYEPAPNRCVLVGVGGSAGRDAAIEFAFEAAALRGRPVQPMLVWAYPPPAGRGASAPAGQSIIDAERAATEDLDAALAGWQHKYPDVPVRPALVRSRHPARALLAASIGADIVVIGRNRRGQVRNLPGGSVGHTLVHHANCPVALVNEPG